MKGCICHFTKWHSFISKGTNNCYQSIFLSSRWELWQQKLVAHEGDRGKLRETSLMLYGLLELYMLESDLCILLCMNALYLVLCVSTSFSCPSSFNRLRLHLQYMPSISSTPPVSTTTTTHSTTTTTHISASVNKIHQSIIRLEQWMTGCICAGGVVNTLNTFRLCQVVH